MRQFAAKIPFLSENKINVDEISFIADKLQYLHSAKGKYITREGQRGEYLHVMIAGQATQYSSQDYEKLAVPFEDLFNDKKIKKMTDFKSMSKKVSKARSVIQKFEKQSSKKQPSKTNSSNLNILQSSSDAK